MNPRAWPTFERVRAGDFQLELSPIEPEPEPDTSPVALHDRAEKLDRGVAQLNRKLDAIEAGIRALKGAS